MVVIVGKAADGRLSFSRSIFIHSADFLRFCNKVEPVKVSPQTFASQLYHTSFKDTKKQYSQYEFDISSFYVGMNISNHFLSNSVDAFLTY